MINKIPSSWEYNDKLENLFLFYQASEEMLSFTSPDSYRLTVHNPITLVYEIKKIYSILKESGQIETYYKQYIPPIIEELIYTIQQDSIVKKALGVKLDSMITGLNSAIDDPALLMRWINLFHQTINLPEYENACKEIIIDCIIQGKDKKKLLYHTNNYYVCLVNSGYNPEFIYQNILRFFDNRSSKITSPEQIKLFLARFNHSEKEFELLLVADTYLIDTFININPNFASFIATQKIDEEIIKKDVHKAQTLQLFYDNYSKLKNRENISIISYKTKSHDPYSALEEVENYFKLLQVLTGYFKHKAGQRFYFDVIQKQGSRYYSIKLRKLIPNRPYLTEETINQRIGKILEGNFISSQAFDSVLSALEMHHDAINCKNDETMLRTFWTATETLFFDSSAGGERETATYSLLRILEKTYLLKVLRTIFAQIQQSVDSEITEDLGINTFKNFVIYFSSYAADSEEFKRLTGLFGNHPLLRSRIYNLRKELNDTKHIREKIDLHNKKILWQIQRIYRTRNLSTHAGISMPYIKDVLFNLHNYFDYVINYIICKLENDERIANISTIVFSARNDNQIYMESLKCEKQLSKDTCFDLLLGLDANMIKYEFETETCAE